MCPSSCIYEGLYFLDREDIPACNIFLCLLDAGHRGIVLEELKGCFQRLEVIRGKQDHVVPSIPGHVNAVMCAMDVVGDLGEPRLDL